ncbi:MAG: Trk system potassium transporter TrkA [Lachnospiraceae bacterium]|nr:Trk system potassium transporter TrkA [Lachnospiraceae bacterium]
MRIIVAGCGKVGWTITEELSREGHDIAVIDIRPKVIEAITNSFDVLGVVGNAASFNVQKEAGIDRADLLIAVTDADEENMLTCLIAKKAAGCRTVARVRNPVYTEEIGFIKEELGLSMIINPELAAAGEIASLLRFPSAIDIDSFARGRLSLLKFVIPEGSPLDRCAVKDIRKSIKADVLICTDERNGEVVIPDGHFVLQAKDKASIVATPDNARAFFDHIGLEQHRIRSCIIIGGGTIAYYLMRALRGTGIHVTVIEQDEARCRYLSEQYPQADIICGDGTNERLLQEEGIAAADSFVALTGIDETNIFLTLYAKNASKAKSVVKVGHVGYRDILETMDLGSIVDPKSLTAERIISFVRAMQNSIGSNVETLYRLIEGKVEALEFAIQEGSPVVGPQLSELRTKKGVLVAAINRGGNGKILIPNGQSTIQVGDRVVVVTTHSGFRDIKDILE